MSSDPRDRIAEQWEAEVEERCQPEKLRLMEATRALWARKPENVSHITYLRQVIHSDAPDEVIVTWRTAKDAFTAAVETRTGMRGAIAEGTYIGVLDEVIKSL